MVAICFVLSGYALSYKPVRQMRNGEIDALVRTLSSSVFRRAIRLYLPCVASTLLIVLFLRLELYEWIRAIAYDPLRLPADREPHPERTNRTGEQVSHWARIILAFINPFMSRSTELWRLDGHLLTIPIEYINSIVLYVTQLGLCRVSARVRMLCLICLILCAHQVAHWSIMLFYSGFLLAELEIRRTERATAKSPRGKDVWSLLYVSAFLCALYLGAQPERRTEQAPGWTPLVSWIPAQSEDKARYWTTWGALLLVWSTSSCAPLQRFFTNRGPQYLGKMSFSMYLLQGNFSHTLGYGLFDLFWRFTRTATSHQREAGFVFSAICVLAATVWLADIFARLVDVPAVEFAKWVEEKCLTKRPTEEQHAWHETRGLI